MTTSGTTAFTVSLGEGTLYAFQLCGIRPTALIQEHMQSARTGANLLLADLSNRGVNLWKVDLVTVPLVAGQATYSVDPSVIVMLDTYIRTTTSGASNDRLILPVSRSEYATYADKAQAGFPTVYWNDRLLSPNVTLWPVPDGTQTSLMYYALKQMQDANFTSGQTLDLPYLWIPAFIYGLAAELAEIWAPDRADRLERKFEARFEKAADTNTETSAVYISPGLSSYWQT